MLEILAPVDSAGLGFIISEPGLVLICCVGKVILYYALGRLV